MLRALALATILFSATWATAAPTVDCDHGQSLNRMLSQMNKSVPTTILVKGTCTEYFTIKGFDGLTLKGLQGATLLQPSAVPANGLFVNLLSVESSQSVTIDGFTIHSSASAVPVAIGRGSVDIRLRNLTIESDGAWVGTEIYEGSQVSLAYVTVRNLGYLGVGAYDESDVHIEDCLIEHPTGEGWHAGIGVVSGHVTMHHTNVRNMAVGIDISSGGVVDIWDYNSYYPLGGPLDVVIENPAGTNFYGVRITGGGSLNLKATPDAKLRITNPGQPWGGDTGGVRISDDSTLNAGTNLEITGSRGHGVLATGNSHVSMSGSRIIGSAHGGAVTVNMSTISVGMSNPLTEISGNGTDLFCDSRSLITGGANIANSSSVQCNNLIPGEYENLP